MNEIRHNWTLEELMSLHNLPLLSLISQAHTAHQLMGKTDIQRCSLISIKTGGCVEDCKYCAQSSHYKTAVRPEKRMPVEEVIKRAKKAKAQGATRVCLGAAYREVREGKVFEETLQMIRSIAALGVEVCCTLGMLNQDQAMRLKEAGLTAYNHNLDTSERFYKEIITTRTYQDRVNTLQACEEAGLSVCSGGILGLGESVEDRMALLIALSSRTPHPSSVPINCLEPIPGTPLGDRPRLPFWDLLRTIAVARLVLPRSRIRLAAGREKLTEAEQMLCFFAGANSIFIGNQLLTVPNAPAKNDQKLLKLASHA